MEKPIAQQGLSVREYDTLPDKLQGLSVGEYDSLLDKVSLWESMIH